MTQSITNPEQPNNATSSLDILLQAIEIKESRNAQPSPAHTNITPSVAAAKEIAHETTQTHPSNKRLASELSPQPSTVANKRAKTTGLPSTSLVNPPSSDSSLVNKVVLEAISKHQGICELTLEVFRKLGSDSALKKLHPLSEMMGAKALQELPSVDSLKNVTLLTKTNQKDSKKHVLLLKSLLTNPAVNKVCRKLFFESYFTVNETLHLQRLTDITLRLVSLIHENEQFFGLDLMESTELIYCDKILSRLLVEENVPPSTVKRLNTVRQVMALALIRKNPNHFNNLSNYSKYRDQQVITETIVRSQNNMSLRLAINSNPSPQNTLFINQVVLYLRGTNNLQNRPQDRGNLCFVMAACKRDAQQFTLAADRLKNHEAYVRRLLHVAPSVFPHITNDLKNKFSVVFDAVTHDPHNLAFVPVNYKKNKEIVKQAVLKDNSIPLAGFTFLHAAPELKDDKEFVMQLLEEKPAVFEHMNERLANDPEVVMHALTKHPILYPQITRTFKNNTEFLQQAINTTPAILNRMDTRKIIRFIKMNPDHYAALDNNHKTKTQIVSAALTARPELVNQPNIFPDVATRTFAVNFVNNMP